MYKVSRRQEEKAEEVEVKETNETKRLTYYKTVKHFRRHRIHIN